MGIFCGALNCYDILGVQEDATLKDIKKVTIFAHGIFHQVVFIYLSLLLYQAYRLLTLKHHPDKSSEKNATEVFRMISKAHDVLVGNESRPLFDYYLKNPRVFLSDLMSGKVLVFILCIAFIGLLQSFRSTFDEKCSEI